MKEDFESERRQKIFDFRTEKNKKRKCALCGEIKLGHKFRTSEKNMYISSSCSACLYKRDKNVYPLLHNSEYYKEKHLKAKLRINPEYGPAKVLRERILKEGGMSCSVCKQYKILTEFRKRSDGFFERRCKGCTCEERRKIRKKNYIKRKKILEIYPLKKEMFLEYMRKKHREYNKKNINGLTDSYVKKKLNIPNASKNLIELKREQLKTKRVIRNFLNS